MAGLLFVVFWAAAYSAAWWGAPYLGKFLPVTSPTAFNVIRVVLSIVFCLVVSIGVIFRNVLIYFVDGVDQGPPMGGGAVVAAIVFGSRLGASRDPEQSSLPGSRRARLKPGGLDQGSSASSNPTLPSNPEGSEVVSNRNAVPIGILLGGGIAAGAVIGWAISSFSANPTAENPAPPASVSIAAPAQQVAAPTQSRWMLSYNGAVVFGDKFATETECERARKLYVDGIVERERKRPWNGGLSLREYEVFQEAIEKSQEEIRYSEATYCQLYAM